MSIMTYVKNNEITYGHPFILFQQMIWLSLKPFTGKGDQGNAKNFSSLTALV
jgi:hypothetical protein